MSKRDDKRHRYAVMISAHRDEWAKFNKKQFDKPIKADMTAIKKIWSATSSPEAAVKRIKSYFKSDAEAGWMSAFKTAWVETGNATIVYMHEFLTAKSAYVDGFYDPYSYTPSYFYGKTYNLQLKQDVAETQDVWSQQVNERITGDAFHDKIVGINSTTEDKIHNTIADGVAEGKGHYEIGQDVESKLDETWPGRGMTISRTEANSAMNQATREDMKATAPDLWKTWSTTGMDNVRDWHAEVDGESLPQEEMFTVNGEEMNGPGDDNASPENLINCACCLLAEEPQAGTPLSDEEQARVDEEAAAEQAATSGGEFFGDAFVELPQGIGSDQTFTDGKEAGKAFYEWYHSSQSIDKEMYYKQEDALHTWVREWDVYQKPLRGVSDPGKFAEEHTPILRAMIDQGPRYKGTVYRGFAPTEARFEELAKLSEGQIYIDKGFTSTTTNRAFANEFPAKLAEVNGEAAPTTLVDMKILDARGIAIDKAYGMAPWEAQDEILMMPTSEFQVISSSVRDSSGYKILSLTLRLVS